MEQNGDSAPKPVDLDCTPIPEPETFENVKTLIDITFNNKKTYLAFQEEFITIIKSYYKSKLDDLNVHDDHSHNRIRVSEKLVKKKEGFLVDKTPTMKSTDVEGTPSYSKLRHAMLTDEKIPDVVKKSGNSRNVCFNCDKDGHSLRDCPEPRNMKKINNARNEFNRRELRYHDDNENEYANMVPGKISDDLRTALGLSSTQIPLHVYRMRLFGYPPAWIEEAKMHNSGLSLFVEKDKRQLQPGVDDGEEEDNDFKYDVQKIFDFPGFNVTPSHPYLDQCRMFNAPPMMPIHSKEELIRSLGEGVVNGYKKRKLNNSNVVVDVSGENDSTIDNTILSAADMDIDDQNDDTLMPLGVTVCNEKTPAMEDGELSNDSRSRSPDAEVLIQQRKNLLAEIAESSVFLDTSSINSSLNITEANESLQINNQLNDTLIENSENENRDNSAKDSATVAESPGMGFVDQTIFGCPVLPSFTPFNSLPAGENFQEGVCDVINFENLAESTGKYEKMKKLITKVRVFQKEHQKE